MKYSIIKIFSLASVCFLLQSCSSFEVAKTDKNTMASDVIAEAERENQQQAKPITQQEVLNSLLPPVSFSPNQMATEKRFDLSVKNIDARNFLLGLVDDTQYNMVVSPEVDIKISLQLKNVTVDEVLSALERIYPIMVEKDGKLIFVSSAESMTRIYPVDYLNISRSGKSRTNVAGQAVAQSGNRQNQNQQGTNSSSGQSNVAQISASEIKTESNADFWQELQQSLSLILKNEEKATLVVSPQSGVVVVRAMPRTQKVVESYLGVAQNGINRQVILEAKIIEVSLNEGFQAGIDWRRINAAASGSILTLGQTGQVLDIESSDAPLNGIFSALYQSDDFDAAIELLQTQGEVHVLSSPRVSTVNNQKAIIKVGSDEFFVTDVSTTTVTGTSTATTPDVTLTPFFSGISLDVTPQINQSGDIVLHVHPVISEISDQQKTITLGQDEFTLPLALSNVRESDSIVRARNQQVVVIGGLMQTRIKTENHSTPLLGDIPVIGNIFKQQRDSKIKSELVILLKANIVDQRSINTDLRDARKRFDQF